MDRRTRKLLVLCLLVLVAVSSLSWWLGSKVSTPAQVAANAAAPSPSIISAPIVEKSITDTLVLRGDVKVVGAIRVQIESSADNGEAIITDVRARSGDKIREGSVLVEVSGRPVIALQGRIPMYRTLSPGMQGIDVAQLENALARLGLFLGDPDEVLDLESQFAMRRLYENAGYVPPESSSPTAGGLKSERLAALAEVRAARRQLVEASVNAQESGKENSALVAAAQNTYKRVKHDPQATSEETQAALLDLVHAKAEARRSEVIHEHAVAGAGDDLNVAEQAFRERTALSGPMVPRSEIVFVPTLPAVVTESSVGLGKAPAGEPLELAPGPPVVKTLLTEEELELVGVGDDVVVDAELLGVRLRGRIVSIGRRLVTTQDGIQGYATAIKTIRELPARALGMDVKVTIQAAKTNDRRLVVPLAAVWSSPDGAVRVTKVRSNGIEQNVVVEAGPSGDGYVAISSGRGELRPGDRVLVGF